MDLISRQAAIDAICTEGTRLERNGTVAMAEIKQWCVDILEALPSAEPKIIYCRDCKYLANKHKDGGTCWRVNGFSGQMSNYDFCSYAERRTDD